MSSLFSVFTPIVLLFDFLFFGVGTGTAGGRGVEVEVEVVAGDKEGGRDRGREGGSADSCVWIICVALKAFTELFIVNWEEN
jgi:hypothetical protein